MRRANTLGRLLCAYRAAVGLTSRRVAELSHARRDLCPLSHSSVLALENGKNPPPLDKLLTLAVLYDAPVDTLIEAMRSDMQQLAADHQLTPAQANLEETATSAHAAFTERAYARALGLYRRACDLIGPTTPSRSLRLAHLRLRVAECYSMLELPRAAKDILEELIANPELPAELLVGSELALAEIHLAASQGRNSRLLTTDAVALAVDLDSPLRVRALVAHGRALLLESEAERALSTFAEAQRLAVQYPFTEVRADLERRKGRLLMTLGRTDEALVGYDAALIDARDSGRPGFVAELLVEIARANYRAGAASMARSAALEAKGILTDYGAPEVMFAALYYLFRIAKDDGQGSLAEAYDQRLQSIQSRLSEASEELLAWRDQEHRR